MIQKHYVEAWHELYVAGPKDCIFSDTFLPVSEITLSFLFCFFLNQKLL